MNPEPLPLMPVLADVRTSHPVLAATVEDLKEDSGDGEATYEDGPYFINGFHQRLQDAARSRALEVKEPLAV